VGHIRGKFLSLTKGKRKKTENQKYGGSLSKKRGGKGKRKTMMCKQEEARGFD